MIGTGAFPPVLSCLLVLLALLPVVPIAALLALRRQAAPPRLASVILLLGGLGALVTACLGFTRMSMPIQPYESFSDPWAEAIAPLLLFAYVGFGLGAALGVALVIPGWLTWRRDHPNRHPPAGPSASNGKPPQSASG
jgi:hypothetical protein